MEGMMDQSIKMGALTSVVAALGKVFSKDDEVVIGLYERYMEFYGIQDGVEYMLRIRKDAADNGKN